MTKRSSLTTTLFLAASAALATPAYAAPSASRVDAQFESAFSKAEKCIKRPSKNCTLSMLAKLKKALRLSEQYCARSNQPKDRSAQKKHKSDCGRYEAVANAIAKDPVLNPKR